MGMADRHNSTLAVRASDRKFAEPGQPETAESDALAALAPVLKFDRPRDAEEAPAAAAAGGGQGFSSSAPRGPTDAPLMSAATSARLRDAFATLPQPDADESDEANVTAAPSTVRR